MLNGVGTARCQNGGSSWINYYEQHAEIVDTCSVSDCTRTDIVGAHVLTRETGTQLCIIPLCRGHNHPSMQG